MHLSRNYTQIPEVVQKQLFRKAISKIKPYKKKNTPALTKIIDAGMASFLLHVKSREAAFQGKGFYTIGPCGEELLGGIGLALRKTDNLALHYRHLSTSLVRNMEDEVSYQQLLDRAYSYTVSKNDPISRGRHCLLGGNKNDFLTTSTLASQVPSALGRALAIQDDAISMVTLGDGSINHSHFLSALNLAAHFSYMGQDVPIVFGVSVNDISISYKLNNWTQQFAQHIPIESYSADARDYQQILDQTTSAVNYTRTTRKPSLIFYNNITRRFGHAATDRQEAYLSIEEIEKMQQTDPLLKLCLDNMTTNTLDRFDQLDTYIDMAFEEAQSVSSISRSEQLLSTSAPLVEYKKPTQLTHNNKPQVMRKSMTNVYDEILANNPEARYIGEDVEHGGYYLVTDELKEKYPNQVQDFPPDETTLMGAAIGYAQMGLVPIVEIPYAKYLDCGMDMFTEACLLNWLSAGQQRNGMLIRLQGFDKGTFGGNFHTHNGLNFPPGLDVICFSSGRDYAAGIRYAFQQAKAGRVVMTVDSTHLLNQRDKKTVYPNPDEYITFDDFKVHKEVSSEYAVVTYGTGVDLALQLDAEVIELFCLTQIPTKLNLKKYTKVIFADPCKVGSGPLAHLAVELQNQNKLPNWWRCQSAPKVYHPLGQPVNDSKAINSTFLTLDDLKKYGF